MELVGHLRREHPARSRHEIAVLLERDHGIFLPSSTAGRIMKRKGLYEERVSQRKSRAQRRRKKRLRAQGWMRRAFPGCLLRIEAKHLRFLNRGFYRFTATDCFSRISFSRVCSSAGSACAERFPCELEEYMPLSVLALQTEGGAEFLRHFDEGTERELITHCFSHPYCPKDNASSEGKIQTTEYELWAFREGFGSETGVAF